MATTQKKTNRTGSSAVGGKRTAAPKSGKATKTTRTAAKSTANMEQPRPVRREAGALVCFILAVFTLFGCFGIQAIFIDFFCGLLKGLFGYGFWVVPAALLLGSYILMFHRGRPVRIRLVCAFLMPMLVSALLHGILVKPLEWNVSLVGQMWSSGQALTGGGVLSGILAQAFVSLFSALGATVLVGLMLIVVGLAAFNRTLFDVADWVFNRPRYEYPVEPERRSGRREREEENTQVQQIQEDPEERPQRKVYDIPVEDGPLLNQQEDRPVKQEKKKGFFDRRSRVPAPDQILAGEKAAKEQNRKEEKKEETIAEVIVEAPVVRQPEPMEEIREELIEPIEQVEAAPVLEQKPQEKPVVSDISSKVTREEAQQAAAEVAQDIEDTLAQEKEEKPYQYPPLSLLSEGEGNIGGDALKELNANRQRLTDTIGSFGIDAHIVNVTRGPSVTRYELELDQGVRLNKLTNLADDIALALGASSVRIAPIPDQISMVGIEVPNKLVSPVNIHSVIGSRAFTDSASKVSFAVGKDIGGNPIVGNIAKMPHMLIAGTTGSGKSVCTNSLIISLLYKATPEEVRLIMVDPKMVELGIYNGIPHLLIPVVTDPKKAAGALQWAVCEMMKRYRAFSEVGVRDLASYNAMAARTEGMEKMPQVVVIIDELADLMLVAAKEVEESICRVAQMGRASGMHLIIATQRPSADVITGLMKANIPSRIAFAVASSLESRIILDVTGAEKLIGRGDMLYFPLGSGKPTRVQGCLITDQEVAAVVKFIKQSGTAQYDDAVMQEIEQHAAQKEKGSKPAAGAATSEEPSGEYDELIDAATDVIVETGQASVSMLQRRLKLGYARAARLVDQLEERGIVGPFEGSKPRQLLITKEQWQEMKYRQGTVLPKREQPESIPTGAPQASDLVAAEAEPDEVQEDQL